jgi:uncharacterized protein YjbI with pentapeptide repeats
MTRTTKKETPMTLQRYTPAKLQTVLANHKKWLAGDEDSRADLYGADLSGVDLTGSDLAGADISDADLSGANLTKAILAGANLHGTDLAGANLTGANLDMVNLTDADLYGANLARTSLYGAGLAGAKLAGANLSGANLDEADLAGADLSGANLVGAKLTGARYEDLKLAAVVVLTGLYKYQCWAAVSVDGAPYVLMGCLFHSVDEWDAIGIRNSNPSEFPDDGSAKSEERVAAFEFVRAKALRMAEAHRKEMS